MGGGAGEAAGAATPAWLLEATFLVSVWAPGETGAALTKRSRAGAGAAGSWPISGD